MGVVEVQEVVEVDVSEAIGVREKELGARRSRTFMTTTVLVCSPVSTTSTCQLAGKVCANFHTSSSL